ncbi:MrcB family domain-containing protein [Roseovarius sp. D0-M9]|uniref:MrcB family domain-containing protein n=1 Tax=Roseovarius sp. D0-M9 TaxID=3127117 RepID=UPI0030101D43
MASKIIDDLLSSDDKIDREIAGALLELQDGKAEKGLSRALGYEPREIKEKGAVAVIEARVMKSSSGFEDVDSGSSYEAIVDRHPERFREEVVTSARQRLQTRQATKPEISSDDVRLIANSRAKQKYAELSEGEKAAYVKVTAALEALGNRVKSKLSDPEKFEVRLTSGFHIKSGVRGYIPKDLWFSVSPQQNAKALAGMPQIFMIVSERGIEYGYGASVSPNDFSQQSVKDLVRSAAPLVFDKLPSANSSEATRIQTEIEAAGNWFYRRKHRLPPKQNDFKSFNEWLGYLQSAQGKKSAAGTISRYINDDEIEGVDLFSEVEEMARIFEPLLDRDWGAPNQPNNLPRPVEDQHPEEASLEGAAEFAEKLTHFLKLFDQKRTGPFTIDSELGTAMQDLKSWLEGLLAVYSRPTINVKMSVGQGGWTKTPWIALLDERETTSTQRGTYVVFLIAEDLSVTYLTLNQGMTELRDSLGQRGAVERMLQVAEAARLRIQSLDQAGFVLDNNIDLRSETGAAKNYEIGTIAHVDLTSDSIPDDVTINRLLSALLKAYDTLIDTLIDTPTDAEDEHLGPNVSVIDLEPYGIEDALDELFLERDDVERYLDIWSNKKNLILQGAPGVGKSWSLLVPCG